MTQGVRIKLVLPYFFYLIQIYLTVNNRIITYIHDGPLQTFSVTLLRPSFSYVPFMLCALILYLSGQKQENNIFLENYSFNKLMYRHIIVHYNPSVRMKTQLLIPLMFYSLTSTPSNRFLRSFSWQFFLLSEFLPEFC